MKNRSKNQWLEILAEQRASGQTIAAYCEAKGVPVASFSSAKKRFKGDIGAPNGFAKAKVSGSPSRCTIYAPNGLKLVIDNPTASLLLDIMRES